MREDTLSKTRQSPSKNVNDTGLGNALKKALKDSSTEESLNKQRVAENERNLAYKSIKKPLDKIDNLIIKQTEVEKELDETIEGIRTQLQLLKDKIQTTSNVDTETKIEELENTLSDLIRIKIDILNKDIEYLKNEMPSTNLEEINDFKKFYEDLINNPEKPELLEILRSEYGNYGTGNFKTREGKKEKEVMVDKYELIDEQYKELYNTWKAKK